MALFKPATPGFLLTFIATILLAVVSFSVPWFKSVYFLKASLAVEGVNGSITFGTLGYCLEVDSGTTCSNATVGYELDINKLVGNGTPIDIPQVAVKWLTYALVLHIVALALSAGSAVFGLLAHFREMSMTCCSSFIAGIAASIALLAFIFDLAFFYLAKARLNKVKGGSAQIGNAIWLTLIAWVMLFFSGCFYALGRNCIKKRPSKKGDDWERQKPTPEHVPRPPDQMRLDAVKAEADRKARAKQGEVGLPAFAENTPLTARIDGDHVYLDDEHDEIPYRDHTGGNGYAGGHAGYAQAAPGTRAVDEYYSPAKQTPSTYPPHPARQGSGHSSVHTPSSYEPSTYNAPTNAPPVPAINNQFLAAGQGPDRFLNASPANQYGHTAGGTTYHSATSHYQQPSTNQYDRHDTYSPPHQPNIYPDPYSNGGLASPYEGQHTQPAYNPYVHQPPQSQDRSYTLGGDGYGANQVPPLAQNTYNAAYTAYPGMTNSPPPLNTNVAAAQLSTSPVRGPRSPRGTNFQHFDDNPPGYDNGSSNVQGNWGKR